MGKFEEGPKFEKPVPWDESVMPEKTRGYLRKLYEHPKEVEKFWSNEELGKNLEEKRFLEMMNMGILALDLEYRVLDEKEGDEEYNRRYRDYKNEVRNLLQQGRGDIPPLAEPEKYREWFALTMKFMIDEGVPEEKFNLAGFIGRAYELEAQHYADLGIPIGRGEGKAYPFEETRKEAKKRFGIKEAGADFEREEKKKSREKIETREPPNEEILSDREKKLAERGEEYLSGQEWPPEFRRKLLRLDFYARGPKAYKEAYEDFEKWYQERKKKEK